MALLKEADLDAVRAAVEAGDEKKGGDEKGGGDEKKDPKGEEKKDPPATPK